MIMDDYENSDHKSTMKMSALTIRQFLGHLCDYRHPLTSMFIMEWLNRGCLDVIKNKEEILKDTHPRSIVSPEAWVECAETLKKAMEERNNGE